MTRTDRRTVLLGIAGMVVGTAVGGLEMAHPATRAAARTVTETRRAARPSPADGAPEVPSSVAPAPLRLSTSTPPWARRWSQAPRDLHDLLRRDRSARFPSGSVMLTIDDGPSPQWTPRYLRLLAKHDVHATFNVIGEQVRANRRLVRATVSEGHVVANHTWTHDEQLPFRSRADIRREITRTNEAVHDATGTVPGQFRAPGGVWGPRVFDELAAQRMLPIGWDIDPRDWAMPGTGAIERALLATRPGDIMLCHDGGGDREQTYRALERVIPALLERGFRFVTLSTARV